MSSMEIDNFMQMLMALFVVLPSPMLVWTIGRPFPSLECDNWVES